MGHLQRRIAHRLVLPELGPTAEGAAAGRFFRCHRCGLDAGVRVQGLDSGFGSVSGLNGFDAQWLA